MKHAQFTDNQIKAIKHIQWLSFNDEDFQLKGYRNLKFSDVLKLGEWTLEDLEELGAAMTMDKTLNTFKSIMRTHIIRKPSKIPLREHSIDRRRSLNSRDKKLGNLSKRPRISKSERILTATGAYIINRKTNIIS